MIPELSESSHINPLPNKPTFNKTAQKGFENIVTKGEYVDNHFFFLLLFNCFVPCLMKFLQYQPHKFSDLQML